MSKLPISKTLRHSIVGAVATDKSLTRQANKMVDKELIVPDAVISEAQLWQDALRGARQLTQDTVLPVRKKSAHRRRKPIAEENEQTTYHLSDTFDPFSDDNERMTLLFPGTGMPANLWRRLKRGECTPQYTLDLHGHTLNSARQQVSGFLQACQQEDVRCVCFVHGRSHGPLRGALNTWLRQIDAVLAYHPAPPSRGGDGAVIVLLRARLI